MIIDRQNCFNVTPQNLTGTSLIPSTDVIDFGSDREMGFGEDMVVLVTITTTAGGTSPTLTIALETDSSEDFSTKTVLLTTPPLAGSLLVAGARFALPIPKDTRCNRYLRVAYTQGGTSPTCSVTAVLLPAKFADGFTAFPRGYTVV